MIRTMKIRRRHGGLLAAALGLVLLAPSVAQARVIERIIAVVNKEIILLSELRERIEPLIPQLRQLPPSQRKPRLEQAKKQMLGQMVDQKLIEVEARKLKISVRDKDLELAIKDVMAKNNLTRAQLAEALKREGKSIQAYKQVLLRPQLLRIKVLNVQVRPRVSVSDDEVKARYAKNLRALGVETKVRARHIFLAVPANATPKQLAERRAFALKVLAQAKAQGADFAKLAKQYSNDSVTRGDGGDLGLFGRGTLPSAVEDVVFAQKKGTISGPLLTERGFHLIQVTERQESSARPYKEVRRQLKGQIFGEKMEKATKAWLSEVRKRSYVDIRL